MLTKTESSYLGPLAAGRASYLGRAVLPLAALLAILLLVTIFFNEKVNFGPSQAFTLSKVSVNGPLAINQKGPVVVSAGRYRLETSTGASEFLFLSDKNIRRPSSNEGSFEQTALGFVWSKAPGKDRQEVEFETIGVARIAVFELSEAQARAVVKGPAVIAALFAGGLAMMGIYACIVAIFGRLRIFGTYTVWVVSTLALGAVTSGYDLIWFGTLPSAYLEQTLKYLICAIWPTVCPVLFLGVFDRSITSKKVRFALKLCQFLGFALIAIAPISDSKTFMSAFWLASAVTVVVHLGSLFHVWGKQGSSVSTWYSIGWIMQFVSMVYELGVAFGFLGRGTTPSIIPTSAIATLFVGIAIVETIQEERKAKLIALRLAEKATAQLSNLFKSSPAGLLSFNHAGHLLEVNPKARALLELGERDRPNLGDLLKGATKSTFESLASKNPSIDEYSLSVPVGMKVRRLNLRVQTTKETTEVAVVDNTASESLAEVLKQQVVSDPLTGLRNRRALHTDLTAILRESHKADRTMLVLVDIKRFRDINAYFGQSAGDGVLKELGARLHSAFRGAPTYRLAADTFVTLVSMDAHEATRATTRITASVAGAPFVVGRRSLTVAVTCAAQSVHVFTEADEALGSAKYLLAALRREGQDAKVFSSEDPILTAWQLEQQFVKLIRNDEWQSEVTLFAQPLVGLQGDNRVRYELLLRVRDGQRWTPPSAFLSAAESIGAMPEIDLHVVGQALSWIESLAETPYYVTANLSGASLADPEFLVQITGLLRQHRSAAEHLCVEVTESVAVKDLSGAARFFNELRSYGVRIALDDFGQGYTNFSYLAELPADIVKLDGGVVKDILTSEKHLSIVKCLAKLSHGLSMTCIAEWVESKESADILAAMGVDLAQGWYFGKAMPLEHWSTNKFPQYRPLSVASVTNARDFKATRTPEMQG